MFDAKVRSCSFVDLTFVVCCYGLDSSNCNHHESIIIFCILRSDTRLPTFCVSQPYNLSFSESCFLAHVSSLSQFRLFNFSKQSLPNVNKMNSNNFIGNKIWLQPAFDSRPEPCRPRVDPGPPLSLFALLSKDGKLMANPR